MIEVDIIRYLSPIVGVPVYAERPEKVPGSYIIIERTASEMHNYLWQATIALQCYAPTLLSAATLCDRTIKAMLEVTDLPHISRSELNTSYNYTMPGTREHRYQAVFDLTYHMN